MRRIALAVACGIAAAAVLSGCSGTGTPEPEETTLSWDDSPLGEYTLRNAYGSLDEEEQRAQRIEREELIAACMERAGFDYKIVPQMYEIAEPPQLDAEWGTREYAERYGFGVFTDPEGRWHPDYVPDPNEGYTISFGSISESEAWDLAMHGTQRFGHYSSDYPEEDKGDYDWRQNGCSGEASHLMSGADARNEFEDLLKHIRAVQDEAWEDPRLDELDKEWARCMQEAGYPDLTDPSSQRQAYHDRFGAMIGAFDMERSQRPSAEESAGWTMEDWQHWADNQPRFDSTNEEVRAEAEKEIAQAIADWDCQESLSYEESRLNIVFDVEQQFIDENKSELEALKLALEQAQG